MAAASSS